MYVCMWDGIKPIFVVVTNQSHQICAGLDSRQATQLGAGKEFRLEKHVMAST